MRSTEKFLPVILALLIPGMTLLNQNQMGIAPNPGLVLPHYFIAASYLYILWHLNRLYSVPKEHNLFQRLGRTPTVLLLNLILISVFVLGSHTAFALLNYIGYLPWWLIAIRLSIASVVFFMIQRALEAIKQRETFRVQNLSLQAENLKSQLEAMKQQINPHFLFNSLNSLLDLIEEDQEKAAEFVRSFSNLYRIVLQSSQRDFITLEDELSFLEDYWRLIKMRFNEAVDLKLEIPEQLKSHWIPPLSLQLLIENAVKHNLATPKEKLVINIKAVGKVLEISNVINPKEFEVKGEGVGLTNLQKRYTLLLEPISYGREADLFVVRIPLKPA